MSASMMSWGIAAPRSVSLHRHAHPRATVSRATSTCFNTAPTRVVVRFRSAGASSSRFRSSPSSSSSSRSRRLRCDAAASGGAGSDESFDGELIANNAASLNGKLRSLVVGITDEQGEALLNHRKSSSGTLFNQQRWVDGFTCPGQYLTITDVDSGKSIRKPISVSPYRARSTAPGSDVSVVEILLDTNSQNGREDAAFIHSPTKHISSTTLQGVILYSFPSDPDLFGGFVCHITCTC